MKKELCIAGSGKIALNAGMYFLAKGNSVTWVSHTEENIVRLQSRVTPLVHRLMKQGGAREIAASFLLYDELGGESFDVVLECTNESVDVKRRAVAALVEFTRPDALIFSSSSSILPGEISDRCRGFHVFHPMELTGIAEVIMRADAPNRERRAIRTFCDQNELRGIFEDDTSAFAVNRLLLPVQNEVFAALGNGISYADADACSSSSLAGIGMCEFARTVGPATIAAAVANYRRRMSTAEAGLYAPLAAGLSTFESRVDRWKAGRALAAAEQKALAVSWHYLFANTCLRFLERGEVSAADLDCALKVVFGAVKTLEQAVRDAGKKTIARALRQRRGSGGAAYLEPSALLD